MIPPQPLVDAESRPYWDSLASNVFALSRCQACRRWQHPPLERCRECAGPTALEPASGRGRVHSYIVVRYPAVPALAAHLPYRIGLVDLDEQDGLRIAGVIDSPDPANVEIGATVQADIVAGDGCGQPSVVFRPAPG